MVVSMCVLFLMHGFVQICIHATHEMTWGSSQDQCVHFLLLTIEANVIM